MRLDRSKFRSWLKARPADEIVGYNRDCLSCPIATFYCETSGGSEIVIFDDQFGGHTIDRGYSKRPLPWWAELFVIEVDGDVDGKISAGRALEVMAHI